MNASESSESDSSNIIEDGCGIEVYMGINIYDRIGDLSLDIELEEEYRRSETDGRNVEFDVFLKKLMNE